MGVKFSPGDAPIVPRMPEIVFISDMIENYISFAKVIQHSFSITFFFNSFNFTQCIHWIIFFI